jgi:ABC-type transport system involved in multi-copper enzyme maturation permease subunit
MNQEQNSLTKQTEKTGRRRLLGWLELELASIYHTPFIEGTLLALVFISFLGVTLTAQFFVIPVTFQRPVRIIIDSLEQAFIQSYIASVAFACQLSILLVPLLIARSFARGFEDGTLVTYLSYPVSRSYIIGLKIFTPTTMIGLSVSIASLCVDMMLIPTGANVYNLLLITCAFFVYILLIASSVSLVAVLSRSSTSTMLIGAGIWYVLFLLQPLYADLPYALRGIINPFEAVVKYLTTPALGPTSTDLLLAFAGALILILVMIFLALILFKQREVRS